MSFVEYGSDYNLCKSLKENGMDNEELSKALNRSKLVQVQRTVNGKHGSYTRKQWVKASDVKDSDVVLNKQNTQNTSKITTEKELKSDKNFDGDGIKIGDDYYWVNHEEDGVWFKDTYDNAVNGGNLDEDDPNVRCTTKQVIEAYNKHNTGASKNVAFTKMKDGYAIKIDGKLQKDTNGYPFLYSSKEKAKQAYKQLFGK